MDQNLLLYGMTERAAESGAEENGTGRNSSGTYQSILQKNGSKYKRKEWKNSIFAFLQNGGSMVY